MIDGVKISYEIEDFAAWKQATKIELNTPVNIETGQVNEKMRYTQTGTKKIITYSGKFETLHFTIKEIQTSNIHGKTAFNHYLTINGSLHKNHCGGNNYLPFTFEDLQDQLTHLKKHLQLSLETAILENIEIGVNIPVPFPAYQFLKKNLISYKGCSFNRYNPNKNGVCLGYYCPLSQYIVKVYDKGKQYNLPENLLRFELRFLKMQKLKLFGIRTFADLQDKEKVNKLMRLLLAAWENVLLHDNSLDFKKLNLKKGELLLLENSSKPTFWETLKNNKGKTYYEYRNRFRTLITKYGCNSHYKMQELIKDEWQNLFKNRTNLPCGKNEKQDKFTVKIKGKNIQTCILHEKRFCASCGRDISNQNNRSRFCSANHVGDAAAHKCRNRNSNPRNNLKNKIDRITRRGVLFDITPYLIVNNNKKQMYAI